MIVPMSPEAPAFVRASADAVLAVHITGGSLGILTGATTLFLRKGERLHRLSGTIFVIVMLTMAVAATWLGVFIPEPSNVTGGLFAFYLVLSAWLTVRRPEGRIGMLEKLLIFVALGDAFTELAFGWYAAHSPTGIFDRYRAPFYYVGAVMPALCAALDWRVIRLGGLSGAQRIARHVWRVCLALFFATGSFFIGQQKVMPNWMQGSPVLLVLGLAPLAFMLFWLGRVWFTRAFKTPALAA